MKKQVIAVEGMSCPHCEMAVQKSLLALTGVKKAKASWKKKQIIVKYDSSLVEIEQLKAAIVEAGYEA